jgi:hypothetical protein
MEHGDDRSGKIVGQAFDDFWDGAVAPSGSADTIKLLAW